MRTRPERVEALARAKQEQKLVLTTVVAVSEDHWVSGHAGARSVARTCKAFLSPNSLQDAHHYCFGHCCLVRALAELPRVRAAELAHRHLAILKRQVEADRSFVEAQAPGKSCSTPMAVLTLIAAPKLAQP